CHAGGRRASLSTSVVRSTGLCGATHPATSEQIRQTSAMAAARMATGEVRKLYPMSLSSQPNNAFFISQSLSGRRPDPPAAALTTSGTYLRPLERHPLEEHEVVGQLDQVDLLVLAPGQRLLVQR